ncbi:AAA family ATPase [Corallococcus sicarius]|uniref:AAA family ATPase n=1 Tax=Corallococcus sicarius TaxID=2316726 RepID=UPI0013150C03|nr:ATP-binding protein [Corallococcus sicarius]
MIESIQIKNLRGIREGRLNELTPLTVLVGPNSSGKSTILDALLIATSLSLGDAVGRAVRRRTERDADARWLLWRQGDDGPVDLTITNSQKSSRTCRLTWQTEVPESLAEKLAGQRKERPYSSVEATCQGATQGIVAWTAFAADNTYEFAQVPERLPDELRLAPSVRFIDMRGGGMKTPLPTLFTGAVTHGRREEVRELLEAIIPGLRNIEILVNPQGEPVLHLIYPDQSVPVALAGDGIRSMLRLGLELASQGRGLALIEEPEVHQHPRAIQQSAKALIASMRRGMQIVLSTHSLELIDSLLLEATEEDLQFLSTYRLKLNDGVLVSSRFSGDKMAFARGQIEDDLR